MKTETVDKLIWTLLYGGMLSIGLGLAVQRDEAVIGWLLVSCGVAASVVGAVLIYVRSRMKEPK